MNDVSCLSRKSAVWTGILFVLPFLAFGIGSSLLSGVFRGNPGPETVMGRETEVLLGAILYLLNTAFVLLLGILLRPVFAMRHAALGDAYLVGRIMEGALLAVGLLALLAIPRLAAADVGGFEAWAGAALAVHDHAYQVAMLSLGAVSAWAWAGIVRLRLLPKWLAMGGAAGYLLLAAGALLDLSGAKAGMLLSIPGGLFELAVGVFLIARGWRVPEGQPS